MYEAFYGLNSKPFQLNPDPGFYFSSKQHQRARAYLEYGVMRCEGFIVITGEVGAGKTTIVRGLIDSLDPGTVVAAHLVSTQLSAEDTLRLVGAAFGIPVRGVSKADLLMALEAFFVTQTLQGKRCLLIVDEAQNLQPQAVEELRMLSNFQNGQYALLQTFLVGQPEFREILQSPGMVQLRQRVTATCHLGPLEVDETREYILHRLKCAGASENPTFDPEIFDCIYHYTGGIPRRVNTLFDRVLLQGFLTDRTHIDLALVNEIIQEVQAEMLVSPKVASPWQMPLRAAVRGIAQEEPLDSELEPGALDLDLSLDSALADSMSQQLVHVTAEQLSARLLRIERSVLRQERVTLEILMNLQKLVVASRRPRSDSAAG
ncbi:MULTISPECIES: XrtA/PEP-CTERM system-associated ATPase [unclassified Acidovorax]|jgi:putative secretion ATPase (PEP-CTERM system associated)|uniref:XrtA/PEP-CTERM system-associated ATPase n=1 Tax=unclassified Acidovorax TaxID=2684926 RepID=UPI000B3FE98F|nr:MULTISPECIES: XrtA/PEP-CTERM system-associated ATPase [unclassified Acidovorax]MBP3981830.1 XrtA-associated ATPase [Acidovorax sp. JG5]MBU4422582.1 XrtA-associated ATPase [Gammaproteobacteria bacterium]